MVRPGGLECSFDGGGRWEHPEPPLSPLSCSTPRVQRSKARTSRNAEKQCPYRRITPSRDTDLARRLMYASPLELDALYKLL